MRVVAPRRMNDSLARSRSFTQATPPRRPAGVMAEPQQSLPVEEVAAHVVGGSARRQPGPEYALEDWFEDHVKRVMP